MASSGAVMFRALLVSSSNILAVDTLVEDTLAVEDKLAVDSFHRSLNLHFQPGYNHQKSQGKLLYEKCKL